MVGRHLTAASRPAPLYTRQIRQRRSPSPSFRAERVGGVVVVRRAAGDAAAAQQGRGGVAGARGAAAGEMSVCSEHLVLISARARTRRRTTRLLFLSYGEKASFPWPEPLSAAQPMHAQKVYARLWPPCSRALTKTLRRAAPSGRLHADRKRPTPLQDGRAPHANAHPKKTKNTTRAVKRPCSRNEPPQKLKPGPSLRAPS